MTTMKRMPFPILVAKRTFAVAMVLALAVPAPLHAQSRPGTSPGDVIPPMPLPPPDRRAPRSDNPWSGQPDVKPTPLVLPDMPRIRIRRGGGAGAGTGEIPRARPQGEGELVLSARLVENGDVIPSGLVFRVFEPETGPEGKLPLVATASGGTARLKLQAGPYLVHASFGRAGATRRINIVPDRKSAETLILDAGGLKLSARLPKDVPISDSKVRFTIYEKLSGVPDERGPLVLPDVSPGSVIRLPAGDYHIVSRYGKVNASTGVDIRVDAGKLTDASVEIAASEVTLKLVRNAGGEAIADTSWIIQSDSGEKLAERIGAFTTLVLAEGEYNIIARNRDQFYTQQISVAAGRSDEVEVVANQTNRAESSEFLPD